MAFGDLQRSLEASQDLQSPLRDFEGREKPLKASKDFSKPHMQTCICFHTASSVSTDTLGSDVVDVVVPGMNA